jgi:ACT domain-containing protein
MSAEINRLLEEISSLEKALRREGIRYLQISHLREKDVLLTAASSSSIEDAADRIKSIPLISTAELEALQSSIDDTTNRVITLIDEEVDRLQEKLSTLDTFANHLETRDSMQTLCYTRNSLKK